MNLPDEAAPFRSLWQALALFGVVMLVVFAGLHHGGVSGPSSGMPPSGLSIAELALDGGGRASLKGHTFPLRDLPEVMEGLIETQPDAAVRVLAPRDLALPVLLEVMTVLKESGVRSTSVVLVAPGEPQGVP